MICVRLRVLVVLIGVLTLFSPPADAQQLQGYGVKIYRVESGLYPFVNAYFRTFNQQMDPLINLNYLNVALMVTGRHYDLPKVQYSVQPIRQRPEAVRTVIVLDASESMSGKPFDSAKLAAANFIDHKRDQDQVAILAVRDTVDGYQVVSTWERNAGTLGRRLKDVRCDGTKSRIYDALGAAMQMTGLVGQASAEPTSEDYVASTAIVIFSDGKDEGSALSRADLNTRITQLDIPVPVYSVAYSKVSTENFKNLEALSKNSFGKYYDVKEAYDYMQVVVENIQDILLNDYVITFRSYVPVDGEQHTFKIGVEYPTGSRKYTYDTAKFESVDLRDISPLRDQFKTLEETFPKRDDGPY